ncbi:Methyltransferase small domain [Carpediemonas membranifera]|uniref:Methyltransferase small domain n=1 Tax=Carpediemonas membranifera TaxID=201153 RepID=A0A8J6E1X5_9EUKA|nr:Methyltransferase small domain [Carpediemonas membranifera]|eukprot:KAG9391192.1 Methyltransferase small domain [Carpediemonas membranifera]
MKKNWQLEADLGHVKIWETPNVKLEQYPTSPHVAAMLVQLASGTYGDIEGKNITDLGCGGGILGIAALLMGAEHVTFVDIDDAVLEIAKENVALFELTDQATFINQDVSELSVPETDVVIMNPPFGTKRKGIDVVFLEQACKIGPVVYSLHKMSTDEFLVRKVVSWGCKATVAAHVSFDIPAMYKFHKKGKVAVEVSLIRIERG